MVRGMGRNKAESGSATNDQMNLRSDLRVVAGTQPVKGRFNHSAGELISECHRKGDREYYNDAAPFQVINEVGNQQQIERNPKFRLPETGHDKIKKRIPQ